MSMMLGGSPKVDSRLNKIVSCVEPKSLSDIMIIRESVLKNDRIG